MNRWSAVLSAQALAARREAQKVGTVESPPPPPRRKEGEEPWKSTTSSRGPRSRSLALPSARRNERRAKKRKDKEKATPEKTTRKPAAASAQVHPGDDPLQVKDPWRLPTADAERMNRTYTQALQEERAATTGPSPPGAAGRNPYEEAAQEKWSEWRGGRVEGPPLGPSGAAPGEPWPTRGPRGRGADGVPRSRRRGRERKASRGRSRRTTSHRTALGYGPRGRSRAEEHWRPRSPTRRRRRLAHSGGHRDIPRSHQNSSRARRGDGDPRASGRTPQRY